MTAAVRLYPAVRTTVPVAGTPVISMYGPLERGGVITNPASAADQGVPVAEVLYVCLTGDAGLVADGSTFAIQPGGTFNIPPGTTSNVSVNAATSGHKFSAFGSSPVVPYVPPTGTFPPPGPTTVTKTIPSYLYEQYSDDEDLPAFFSWFNGEAQDYVGWFADVGLPVYTNPMVSGDLLNWIGAGFYGYPRPSLPSGRNKNIGPLNTWTPNSIPLNTLEIVGNQNYYATTDDIYKRCLTWHLYKGDGKVFTVRWLKRRVLRFLIGVDGTAPDVDDTRQISVTFGIDRQVNINILNGRRTVVGGALPNAFAPNTQTPNALKTSFVPFPQLATAPILKSAIESGVLELPFQFTFVVNII